MKPIVAVSSSRQRIPLNHSSGLDITYTNNAIINILASLSCISIIIPNGISVEDCERIISASDALLLVGGQDIDPQSYGQECRVNYDSANLGMGSAYKRPALLRPDVQRDKIEIGLYRSAKVKNIPILGICRGMQIINIAEGGTLRQELDSDMLDHELDADGWVNHHDIEVVKDTTFYSILKKEHSYVSSIHHQCIDQIGNNLRASAYSADGIIEAIESDRSDQFIVGVQGHIEKSIKNSPDNIRIWNAFTSAIKRGDE